MFQFFKSKISPTWIDQNYHMSLAVAPWMAFVAPSMAHQWGCLSES
jgi:hypothetical protein